MSIAELINKVSTSSSSLIKDVEALIKALKDMGYIDMAVGIHDKCPIAVLKELESLVSQVKVEESYRFFSIREDDGVEDEEGLITEEQWEAAVAEAKALREPDEDAEMPEEPEEITESCKRIQMVLKYTNAPVRLFESLYAGKEAQCRAYIKRYGIEV